MVSLPPLLRGGRRPQGDWHLFPPTPNCHKYTTVPETGACTRASIAWTFASVGTATISNTAVWLKTPGSILKMVAVPGGCDDLPRVAMPSKTRPGLEDPAYRRGGPAIGFLLG